MPPLVSTSELRELREILAKDLDDGRPRIVICGGTACQASGCSDIVRVAKRHIIDNELSGRVALRITGCHGFCEMGPFVLTEPQNAFYAQVGMDDIPRIFDAVISGTYVEDLLYRDPATGRQYFNRDDIPFFKHQQRSILGLNQLIDPIRIYDYIARGGYSALEHVLTKHDSAWVVQEVKHSGLRGRGGAGFPAGVKWEMLAAQRNGSGKFLVCNADEGDPGAYMDRSVLEGNPHSIIEGMLIGAFGTGATEGIVYVRNEYPIAIKHLNMALSQARSLGILGANVLGSGLSFDISINKGAGAFVCGEETALVKSIEGKVGEPRQRPPFPVQRGIDGKPTIINNVETWANIPLVFRLGAAEFAKIGADRNSGTKIFSLVGKIRHTGLVEVPMGTTIARILYDIGGGPSGDARIKAVQTGGPSGGCIPSDKFGLSIDYDSLAKAGSIMGSGGMIVMDENTCMVDVAKYFTNFLKGESCGKCFTCRKGIQRMHEVLDDISSGRGTMEDLDLLEELAHVVKDTTMCGLGQTAANPVLSTLSYFRHEYERHILHKRCDAFVCRELVGAPCQSACPVGTEVWRYVAHLQRGEYQEAYQVIRESNPLPSVCGRVCHHPCEDRCRVGQSGQEPIAIRALKRFATEQVATPALSLPRARVSDLTGHKVAIVGAGPAGLAAAHCLSLEGCHVTVFECESEPGGLLLAAIPEFRLPRDVIRREIASLLDENITLRCNTRLGSDVSLDDLLEQGFSAVLLALGAHRDRRLGLEGEDVGGVYPALEFLKSFNLHGESLAKGRVGIIGGGNCAVDAARIAVRQAGVESVTIIYRRTRREMPAFEEEIDAAIEEGVLLETLVSPVKICSQGSGKRAPLGEEVEAAVEEGVSIEALSSPVKIHSVEGRLTGIECVRNELGEPDSSGRRRPVEVPGTEYLIPLDTLIVAIGEETDSDCVSCDGVGMTRSGSVFADAETMCTGRRGVFVAGDALRGSNTVIDAIADGKNAATGIMQYLRGEQIVRSHEARLPSKYIDPMQSGDQETARVRPVQIPVEARRCSFREIEETLGVKQAVREAGRCLRCDLEFTTPKTEQITLSDAGGSVC